MTVASVASWSGTLPFTCAAPEMAHSDMCCHAMVSIPQRLPEIHNRKGSLKDESHLASGHIILCEALLVC